jgi:hypothetical protein
MTIDPTHHIYNIQLAENVINENYLFQNSPVKPLLPISHHPFHIAKPRWECRNWDVGRNPNKQF